MQLNPLDAEARASAHQLQPGEIPWPPQTPEDNIALAQVVQDYQLAERHLMEQGFPSTWDSYDRLYKFIVPQQWWEGSKVPRASLGMPVVLEHINALMPKVMKAIWGDDPVFEAFPYDSDADAARVNTRILEWELNAASVKSEMKKGVHECLHLGTGIFKYGWESRTETANGYSHKNGKAYKNTGSKKKEKPTFEHIPRRHIFVDPSLYEPDIRKAKYVIHKLRMTPRQLDRLRGSAGYNIPDRDVLEKLGLPPEETLQQANMEVRYLDYGLEPVPQERHKPASINPLDYPLEVLEYWTDDVVYTVLQRKIVIRNERNPWGKLPFCSIYFKMIPNSFDGMGVTGLVGNEQRLQQGLINGLLDELSLQINGILARKRSSTFLPNQVRVSPGKVLEMEDPTKDVKFLERQGVNPAIFEVLGQSDNRAQRRTGANEVTVQGAIPDGSGGIGRTGTGMSALIEASSTLIEDFIDIIAEQVMVPTLEAFHYMNPEKMPPEYVEMLLSDELYEKWSEDKDPMMAITCKLDFSIKAGTKLAARRAMLQTLPMMLQFFQNPAVAEQLESAFLTLNFNELINMLYDATGWPNKPTLVQRMDEEQIAKLQSENPLVKSLMEMQQQKQIETDSKLQQINAQGMVRAGNTVLKSLMKQAEDKEARDDNFNEEMGRAAATQMFGMGVPNGPVR